MAVVTTGMHKPFVPAGPWQSACFLYRQGIKLGPECNGFAPCFLLTVDPRYDTCSGQLSGIINTMFIEVTADII